MGDFDDIRSLEQQTGTQTGTDHHIDPADLHRAALHACNQELRGLADRDATVDALRMLGLIHTVPGRTPDSDGRLRNK